ncbi:MAG: nucleotidyltransferase [Lachnospiraceae bacterium]|nr:nucleotidyltransferase [Lachnospiraceae bacterium]
MKKPVLVIMAAGMGSRYGGLKQIDPIDQYGHIMVDYSVYDAKRAGFEKVIFIIKREHEEIFRERITGRLQGQIETSLAFQDISDLPLGFTVPEGREKPWGTAHAVYSCRDQIEGPFAVINADDYYGVQAFGLIYDYLTTHQDDEKYRYAMVGYELGKTVTESGHVSRGVCRLNEAGELIKVVERTRIEKNDDGIAYTEDEGKTWHKLDDNTVVSMNLWGFSESFQKEIEIGFPAFLQAGLADNPKKCEYYLPSVVSRLLEEEKAAVRVLTTEEKWYGVTYKEDKPMVVEALADMRRKGIYPEKLWE